MQIRRIRQFMGTMMTESGKGGELEQYSQSKTRQAEWDKRVDFCGWISTDMGVYDRSST